MNLFTEVSDTGTPKTKAALYHTPGVRPHTFLGSGPVRGIFYEPSYNRLFAVAGAILWEVFATHTAVARGTLAVDGNPATLCSNGTAGHQLFITSGGRGYIFDLNFNSFQQITAAGFPDPVLMGSVVNLLFVALKSNSNEFHWSGLLDGTSWSSLDVAQTESPNNVLAMVVDHLEVWLLGQRVTEVWKNVGSGNTIFSPLGGAPIEQGIAGSWLWGQMDNTLYWVGTNKEGGAVTFRANGYSPQRVSNNPIDFALQNQAYLGDALAFTYQQDGHPFFWTVLPHNDTDYVLDGSTGLWHERALWNDRTMRFEPHVARCHAFAFGTHLVGDRTTGTIYELAMDAYTDAIITGP